MVPLAFNLGPWEIGLIALLALLLFGGKRLPTLAKDLGNGIKEFRKSISGENQEEKENQSVQIKEEPIQEKSKQSKSKKSV